MRLQSSGNREMVTWWIKTHETLKLLPHELVTHETLNCNNFSSLLNLRYFLFVPFCFQIPRTRQAVQRPVRPDSHLWFVEDAMHFGSHSFIMTGSLNAPRGHQQKPNEKYTLAYKPRPRLGLYVDVDVYSTA